MTEPVLLAVISTIGTIITVLIQNSSRRTMETFKKQLDELKRSVEDVTAIGKKNNLDIAKVANGTKTTESYRLEIDLTEALEKGYRTREATRRVEPMYKSYQELGGNGYIEDLYNQYKQLKVKEHNYHESN